MTQDFGRIGQLGSGLFNQALDQWFIVQVLGTLMKKHMRDDNVEPCGA